VIMLLLEFYLTIKTPFFIALFTWMVGTLVGTAQKIVAFVLETWLYVCSSHFIV